MERHADLFGQMSDDADQSVLRSRADSLAAEQEEQVDEERLSLLLFAVGNEWYAVGIDTVREIYNEYTITPLPCVPGFILGVINIRGEIVSVTDVRQLLRLSSDAPVAPSVIVVENETCATALIVDAIGDIAEVDGSTVEPPVASLDKGQAAFVSGSVYIDGMLVGLLDLEQVLAPIGTAD
jgi:purine-binding chemotaxis protein CheW